MRKLAQRVKVRVRVQVAVRDKDNVGVYAFIGTFSSALLLGFPVEHRVRATNLM